MCGGLKVRYLAFSTTESDCSYVCFFLFDMLVYACSLTINQHISKTACVAFYHIQRLRKVRSILGAEITVGLMSAFILNRLDYCNAVLAHLPASAIAPLQRA